jgi:hypothetical protein
MTRTQKDHPPSARNGAARYREIEKSCGSRDALVRTLQERYGVDAALARSWIEDWADALESRKAAEPRRAEAA